MRIWYQNDPQIDACVMHMEDVRLLDSESITTWSKTMTTASDDWLSLRGGRKWFCLIELSGFEINPALCDAYGQRARSFVDKYFTGVIRYGAPEGLYSTSALKVGAIQNSFPANIYRDREAALTAYQLMSRAAG